MADWITALTGAASAIAGGAATQAFTLWKEAHSSQKNRLREMQYIGAQLVVSLRYCAEHCREVSGDTGAIVNRDNYEYDTVPSIQAVPFNPGLIEGKWDALPPSIQLLILELPLKMAEAERWLDGYSLVNDNPPEQADYFTVRKEIYNDLGSHIDSIVSGLRIACKFSEERSK